MWPTLVLVSPLCVIQSSRLCSVSVSVITLWALFWSFDPRCTSLLHLAAHNHVVIGTCPRSLSSWTPRWDDAGSSSACLKLHSIAVQETCTDLRSLLELPSKRPLPERGWARGVGYFNIGFSIYTDNYTGVDFSRLSVCLLKLMKRNLIILCYVFNFNSFESFFFCLFKVKLS